MALKDAKFLNFKPSQNAAACLLAALNVVGSPELCRAFDFGLIPSYRDNVALQQSLFTVTKDEQDAVRIELSKMALHADSSSACPLRLWSPAVSELTKLEPGRDIRQPYT